ncbi:hypothetical protein [Devosia ginsengisoli]|uniref:hypothetical protein n=1 Tax=Devosia ginsengisoli TaxID=400770 RepID=UPI0026EF8965|nr:hypothetical protein [Devosia ginsengisoli]MCR6673245.1 hypothetical protein [Devosia ginsengisoli]
MEKTGMLQRQGGSPGINERTLMMMRLSRYLLFAFSAAFAFLLAPISFVADAIRDAWPVYQPSASESLALDRLVEPVAIIPAMRSRFRAFVERLLDHDLFRAGHFDPGRCAA